jgi:hypothetical protein
MKNAFDLANEIVENSHEHSEEYQKAKTFLEKYEELGLIIGDCDNPFNPTVSEIIDLEENFLKTINQ